MLGADKFCPGIIPAYAGSTWASGTKTRTLSDHPRIRGEHRRGASWWPSGAGSSPHTRGAPVRGGVPSGPGGIIPAYAGSTQAVAGIGIGRWDHPRIRGEHAFQEGGSAAYVGSSPHTRGARRAWRQGGRGRRIIPAYAGSTAADLVRYPKGPDHPRIRGEHSMYSNLRTAARGSSPHTRGAQAPQLLDGGRQRIIPAYAGSTSSYPTCEPPRTDHPRIRGEHIRSSPGTRPTRWIIPAYAGSTTCMADTPEEDVDHPRIRGEHLANAASITNPYGSSPHTRGAHARGGASGTDDRIIPAYAGSTPNLQGGVTWMGDHPRIRGEHLPRDRFRDDRHGSSPHTRGAQIPRLSRISVFRIIPAYAGSTRASWWVRLPGRDHPRIRGEHVAAATPEACPEGSSPHTRGARSQAAVGLRVRRIIPAYAGSTTRRTPHGIRDPGSSPHTRGAPPTTGGALRDGRIIPAYAGSTDLEGVERELEQDHPRIRGEHR